MDQHLKEFLQYTYQHFRSYFYGDIFNGLGIDLTHLLGSLPTKTIWQEHDVFNIVLTNGNNMDLILPKIGPTGLLLIVQRGDGNTKNITSIEGFKNTFGYRKFYYNPDAQCLFGVCIKDTISSNYIPDYHADYKTCIKDNRRTVVIYTFHEINDNVRFFIKHGLFKSNYIDFVIVCNGLHKLEVPSYVTYLNRENIGHDFGGWAHAIYNLNLREKYQLFVCINSSVRGPFIPPWSPVKNWVHIFTRLIDYKTKLVGTSLGSHKYKMHIQSMVLAFDQVGLDIGISAGIFERNPIMRERWDIIEQKEIGFSQHILNAGYKIRPILSAYFNSNVLPNDSIATRIHFTNNSYYGTNIHPYEVIFIKDKEGINANRDIDAYTEIHSKNFDRLSDSIPIHISPPSIVTKHIHIPPPLPLVPAPGQRFDSPIVPLDFDWKSYLSINTDVGLVHKDESGAIRHWLQYGYREGRSYKYQQTTV